MSRSIRFSSMGNGWRLCCRGEGDVEIVMDDRRSRHLGDGIVLRSGWGAAATDGGFSGGACVSVRGVVSAYVSGCGYGAFVLCDDEGGWDHGVGNSNGGYQWDRDAGCVGASDGGECRCALCFGRSQSTRSIWGSRSGHHSLSIQRASLYGEVYSDCRRGGHWFFGLRGWIRKAVFFV